MTTNNISPNIQITNCYGWEHCFVMKSGAAEIIATADVGPRIVFFGREGGNNLFKLFDDHKGRTGDDTWLIYGGHRLWFAPEDPILSYIPDNHKVMSVIDENEGSLSLIRLADESGLERRLTMRVATKNEAYRSPTGKSQPAVDKTRLNDDDWLLGSFIIRNEIVNRSKKPIKTASWGINTFAPGGVGFMPLEYEDNPAESFQARMNLSLWTYTDFSDPAYSWKKNWLEVDQTKALGRQKTSTWNANPWLGYRVGDLMAVVQLMEIQKERGQYPDFGSNLEVYFDKDMLELETLSAWQTLLPGESVFHDEVLSLINLKGDPDNEIAIRDYVYPLVRVR